MWHDTENNIMIAYARSIHFIKRAVVGIIRSHGQNQPSKIRLTLYKSLLSLESFKTAVHISSNKTECFIYNKELT